MPGIIDSGQYAYVVCANATNYFAEIAAVSMASLRLVCPGARISALIDKETSMFEVPALYAIRTLADEISVVDCPGDNSFARSRYLKSHIRVLLSGRFLYLDGDTLVMKPPDGIWTTDCDVAAAVDLGSDGKPNQPPVIDPRLGWWIKHGGPYLNAGVVYFETTRAARKLGERYGQLWLEYVRVTGRTNDQLAFNQALETSGSRIAVLPSCYNAQISMDVMKARGANIIHFYTGNFADSIETVAHIAAKQLKHDGILDHSRIERAITSGNPWTHINSLRKAMAVRHYWEARRFLWKSTKRLTKRWEVAK